MADTSKLIRYFEASGSGEEARRMLDLAEQVVKGRPYRVADFTSPAGLVIADAIKANYPQLTVKTDGGYEGAERIRIAFVDSDFNGTVDMGIRALDRSKFGDVIVQQGGAQIMVDESVADFVIQNFTKIAMVSVSVEAIELSDIAPKEEKIKEVRTTVASLRLDAVASSGFSVSRTKLVSAINAGLLQVNWQPAKGASQEVKEGDVISMRGRGRMKVEAITGTSRKGRIGVYLKRFM